MKAKKLLTMITASALVLGTVAPAMAMPNIVKITRADGTVAQYSIDEAIGNAALMAKMNADIANAHTFSNPMVGTLADSKVVNLLAALKSGNYDTYESGVQAGTTPQGTNLTATTNVKVVGGAVVETPVAPVVVPLAVQSVSAITNTTVKATLTTAALGKTVSDFTVKVNGVAVTPTAVAADATGANYTITIPTLASTEGNITVNGIAPVAKVATGSDFDFDFKAPTATVQLIDSLHLKVVFSEKVSKAQAEAITNNYQTRKVSDASIIAPSTATLESDGKSVDLTLASALVPASYVLQLNYTANASNVKDLAGNVLSIGTEVAFTGSATADLTAPQLVSSAYDAAAGNLVLAFNEAMDASTFVKTGLTITNGTSNVALTVNENGVWSAGNTVLTVTLAPTQKTAVTALTGNLTLSITASSFKDAALNTIAAVSGQAITAKTVLTAAAYNQATNVLTLTFSNPVNISTLVKTEFTLDGSASPRALLATDVLTTTANSATVNFTVGRTAALDIYETAAITGKNVDFTAAAGTFLDASGLAVAATSNVPLTYTTDTTAPTLLSASYNNSNTRLTLAFSEPVQIDNAADAIVYTPGSVAFTAGTHALTIGACETDTANTTASSASTVVFLDAGSTIVDTTKIYFPTAGAFKDDAGNSLAAVPLASATQITYADQTSPTVTGAATEVSATVVKVTFSKAVKKADAETLANYSIIKTGNPTVTLPISAVSLDAAGLNAYLTTSASTIGYNYTVTVKNVPDMFGNPLSTVTNTAAWTAVAAADTTAPSLAGVAAVYTDVDASKSISVGDTLAYKFPETMNIDFTKVTTADYTLSAGTFGTNPSYSYGAGNDTLKVTLGVSPTVTFTSTLTPAASNDFKDLAGNSAAIAASAVTVNPGVAPKISTLIYADTNASGVADAGDKVTITYDRNITLPNGAAAVTIADFTPVGLAFGTTPTIELANGNQIIVTLGATPTAVVGTNTIDEVVSADIADAWGTTQLAADATVATLRSADTVAPYVSSVVIAKGAGLTGTVLEANDTVTITMSEPVSKPAFVAGDFVLYSGATAITYTGATTEVTVSGNLVTIKVKAGDAWVGSTISGLTTFNYASGTTTIADGSGNKARPTAGFGVVLP